MAKEKIGFVIPGEILLEEFLKPYDISPNRLALEIKVPASRVYGIINGERAITADTDLRLSKYFGTSERFWLNLQARYDIEVQKDELGDKLEREVKPLAKTD